MPGNAAQQQLASTQRGRPAMGMPFMNPQMSRQQPGFSFGLPGIPGGGASVMERPPVDPSQSGKDYPPMPTPTPQPRPGPPQLPSDFVKGPVMEPDPMGGGKLPMPPTLPPPGGGVSPGPPLLPSQFVKGGPPVMESDPGAAYGPASGMMGNHGLPGMGTGGPMQPPATAGMGTGGPMQPPGFPPGAAVSEQPPGMGMGRPAPMIPPQMMAAQRQMMASPQRQSFGRPRQQPQQQQINPQMLALLQMLTGGRR